MLVVVPGEEFTAERSRLFDVVEALREARSILQRLELRFRIRVVVGNVRARMALSHAQIGKEEGDGLGRHRAAAIRMNGERVRENTFVGSGFLEQKARERLAFSVGQEPPDDVPTVDVDDDV